MNRDQTLANDLLLLLANLSQMHSSDRIKDMFVDALNGLDLGFEARFSENEDDDDSAEVVRLGHASGSISLIGFPGALAVDGQAIVRNAIKMVGVILANKATAEALAANHTHTKTELAEIRELHQRILETTPDLIYIYDMVNHCNVYSSGAVRRMLGVSPEEIVAMGSELFAQLLHPDDIPAAIAHQEKIRHSRPGEVMDFEYRMRCADGEYLWVHAWEQAFERDANGAVIKKIGAAVDVSRQKAAEDALRRSETRFRIATECMSDLVYEWDTVTGVVSWIGDVSTKLGRSKSEIGRFDSWMATIHPGDRENVRNEMLGCLASGSSFSIRCLLQSKGSAGGTWMIHGQPTNEGSVIGACADITEREQVQRRFSHARRMESIGELAGGIAHDFNNLLSSIISPAELVKMKTPGDRLDLHRYLDMIVTSAERAADRTKKLLAFSRKQDVKSIPVDLCKLLTEVQDILEHTLDPKVVLHTTTAHKACWVLGDPSDLQNTLLNLAVNARDAMPNGGNLELSVEAKTIGAKEASDLGAFDLAPGDYYIINVADDGMGIPPDKLDRIFDPFFTTKEIGEGTGLGLAAVYGTAIAHCGAVTVQSEPGKGAAFSIYLPLHSPENLLATEQTTGPITGSGCILVVDDEEIIRETAQEILETLGYEVLTKDNGVQAIEFLNSGDHGVDLCILDLAMPEMGGDQVLELIQEKHPELKTIVLTGYLLTNQKQDLLRKGASMVLQKPLRMDSLSVAVSNVLSD